MPTSRFDANDKSKHISKIHALPFLVALLASHTLETTRYSYYPDGGYTRYTLIAALWSTSYETGSTITGPHTTVGLVFPIDTVSLWAVVILPLSLYIICTERQFMREEAPKTTVLYAILALLLCK
ncbi:MAG: hypothetical protein EAX81_06805 [Candidatus Thorarchaeota archaeon]|nr:hypothetical protein [Candidatus Thorarchaeota archaeon]